MGKTVRIKFYKIYKDGLLPRSFLLIEPKNENSIWGDDFLRVKNILDENGCWYEPADDSILLLEFSDGILLEKELREAMGNTLTFKEGIFIKDRDGVFKLLCVVQLEGHKLVNLKNGYYINEDNYIELCHYSGISIRLSDLISDERNKMVNEAVFLAHLRGIISYFVLYDLDSNFISGKPPREDSFDTQYIKTIKFKRGWT